MSSGGSRKAKFMPEVFDKSRELINIAGEPVTIRRPSRGPGFQNGDRLTSKPLAFEITLTSSQVKNMKRSGKPSAALDYYYFTNNVSQTFGFIQAPRIN